MSEDPIEWIENNLGVTLDSWQKEFMRTVLNARKEQEGK